MRSKRSHRARALDRSEILGSSSLLTLGTLDAFQPCSALRASARRFDFAARIFIFPDSLVGFPRPRTSQASQAAGAHPAVPRRARASRRTTLEQDARAPALPPERTAPAVPTRTRVRVHACRSAENNAAICDLRAARVSPAAQHIAPCRSLRVAASIAASVKRPGAGGELSPVRTPFRAHSVSHATTHSENVAPSYH